ncbi:MAG: hypothetical protein ACD_22C00213G0002, partial [uncultured bacterium]
MGANPALDKNRNGPNVDLGWFHPSGVHTSNLCSYRRSETFLDGHCWLGNRYHLHHPYCPQDKNPKVDGRGLFRADMFSLGGFVDPLTACIINRFTL